MGVCLSHESSAECAYSSMAVKGSLADIRGDQKGPLPPPTLRKSAEGQEPTSQPLPAMSALHQWRYIIAPATARWPLWRIGLSTRVVNCTEDRHAGAILAIFNEAILTSTALYDYKPRSPDSMGPWFAAKVESGYPVIGLEDERGALLAFGSYGAFRAWPAYKYTVEHSVYVHRDYRGQGLGRVVMQELIAAARTREVHCMIGGIDTTNVGSIILHKRLGFRHVGTLPQVGFKFGRWLDLSFYQLLLDTPAEPVDD